MRVADVAVNAESCAQSQAFDAQLPRMNIDWGSLSCTS